VSWAGHARRSAGHCGSPRLVILLQANGGPAWWLAGCGPPVSEPTRKGFGTVILIDTAKLFARRAVLSYDPAGLRYELLVSLDAVAASAISPLRSERPIGFSPISTGTSLPSS
jgi:hypothetical protein